MEEGPRGVPSLSLSLLTPLSLLPLSLQTIEEEKNILVVKVVSLRLEDYGRFGLVEGFKGGGFMEV